MIGIKDDVAAVCEKRQEQKRQRDLLFQIPSRIILNEKGTSFFIAHGKALHCFESADGERHFGFHLEQTGFAWLKKLILHKYLRKMEIQVKDISTDRVQLEDTIKLIFFSMFRQRINTSILSSVYDSPVVRAWNRTNPKKSIGPGMKIAERSFGGLLNSLAPERLEGLKSELYCNILESLPPSFVRQQEDPRDLRSFVAELVFHINPFVFFVLAGSKNTDAFMLIKNISRGIIECIYRFDIVNLAALLTIELVSAAERSALVRLLENVGNTSGLLEDPVKRKSIMEKRRFHGSTVVVAVPDEIPREDRRLRFRISVHNDGADAEAERRLMEDFTERSFNFKDGKDLEEFFKSPRSRWENGIYEDKGLCFYHLSTLREQCRKNKILLDTAVKNSHSGKSVVTTLWFGF
jgi:hypothetical protein